MGLNMYAHTTKEKLPDGVDFFVESSTIIHRWEEHASLHGWMKKLYHEKGGAAGQFNCAGVALTRQDLDRLEKDLKLNRLPQTTAFFLGEGGWQIDDDLAFIAKARKALSAHLTVYYVAWY